MRKITCLSGPEKTNIPTRQALPTTGSRHKRAILGGFAFYVKAQQRITPILAIT